jgi:hypothetical protein
VKHSQADKRCCAICGSTKNLSAHHLGGRKHARFFTIPLCDPHHQAVHIVIARARVNLQHTTDKAERARRARMAALVFMWFLDEQIELQDEDTDRKEKQNNQSSTSSDCS